MEATNRPAPMMTKEQMEAQNVLFYAVARQDGDDFSVEISVNCTASEAIEAAAFTLASTAVEIAKKDGVVDVAQLLINALTAGGSFEKMMKKQIGEAMKDHSLSRTCPASDKIN